MAETIVGFVGLGLMGAPMAARLRDRGFPVNVYNRTRSKADPLQGMGAQVAESPRALARDSSVICLMLQDAPACRAILDGKEGLAAGLASGKVVVNSSTVGIQGALDLERRIAETGAAYVDAPVLGSTDPAASGDLIMMIGGPEPAVDQASPVLEALSRRRFRFGPAGSASAVKLILNMLLARYVEALGEILTLSRKFQVDPLRVLELIQTSALASPSWEKGPRLLAGPPPLHFPLRHMVKDLRLLDEEVDRAGLTMGVEEAVLECFLEASQSGRGDRDYSELALWMLEGSQPR